MSEINTDKAKKNGYRKCVGTNEWTPIEQKKEVTILKKINQVRMKENVAQAIVEQSKKRTWREANLSKQDKLCVEILESERNKAKK